jgi:hypothetical protein
MLRRQVFNSQTRRSKTVLTLVALLGGYLTFMQGDVIEAVSTMPAIVSQSTCEAEYCLCVMAGSYIRMGFNEMIGFYSHRPLTILVGLDSKSVMDTAFSPEDMACKRRRQCLGRMP